jgi:linalool dehydratase/isomerase-like protein
MTQTAAAKLPPIPIPRGPRGRLVGAQRRKRLAIVAVLWCIGITPTVLDFPLPWNALGVGLIFPGAGVLYRGHAWLFLIVLALAAVAIYRMWVMADHIAMPALYLGAAVLAPLLPGDNSWPWVVWVVPSAVAASLAIVEALQWTAYMRARRLGRERNAYVESRPARTDFTVGSFSGPDVVESTEGELRLQRWVLDHALQPVDDWDVYDWSEKAQRDTRSVRYQLNWLQWALAIGQYTRTPAFTGYLAEGQRRLIERMRDRRIWGYWRGENIAGNLDFNADPVRKDNIMFSGYLELMVGTYAVLNSDRRYDAPGALTFTWDRDHRFVYDHASLSDVVENNFRTSRFGLFACEPTFVFPDLQHLRLAPPGLSRRSRRRRADGTAAAPLRALARSRVHRRRRRPAPGVV